MLINNFTENRGNEHLYYKKGPQEKAQSGFNKVHIVKTADYDELIAKPKRA